MLVINTVAKTDVNDMKDMSHLVDMTPDGDLQFIKCYLSRQEQVLDFG